jgi:enamine deaminase RidA (YjgF/YER057c/UK114 family)
LVAIESGLVGEYHLTLTPLKQESARALAQRLAEVLHGEEATVVRLLAFGAVREQPVLVAALRQALEDPVLPVTWAEGDSCTDAPVAGLQVHAVSGLRVQTIGCGDQPLGRVWSDARAMHCVLGGVVPTIPHASAPTQARQTFELLQAGLAEAGMAVGDVARTWFFLDDILGWYGEFNRVRNDFFAQSELRPGRVPASTGVSGRNAAGAALTAAAWAVRAHEPEPPAVEFLPSPKQCPAPAYGSAFSRAAVIRTGGFRQLLVSGTASIAPDGRTTHVADAPGQIERTMEVIYAILESQGMRFSDTTRAVAYFKSATDAPLFRHWLEKHKLAGLPVVFTRCDICRDDLLFELELDAVAAGEC